MIVTYNIRKISIQDISKRKYDIKMLGKKDDKYFIQQQNNQAFRQIKQLLQNKKYMEIYNLNHKIKQINRKYDKETNQERKNYLFNKIIKLKNKLKDIQRIDEMIFLQSPKKCKKSLVKVLKEGFYYNDEKYVRFGKSASQAKQGVTVFIQEKYYDEMLERSQLGIDVKKCVISKYEAYRNLILSACEFAEIELPHIVIVDDFEKTIPNQYIRYVEKEDVEYIDKKTKEKKIYKGKKVVEESYKNIDIEPFDGMGIHTKEIGEKWAKAIGLKYIPISYQVRIPFMKGMSTQAPIKEVYKEWGITEITDMFGYKHKVEDIDCIWTKSMWKGCGIFKDEFGNEAFNQYMNRLKKYNYCMGFSKYSHQVDHMQLYTKMNFQYLQCLDLWNKKYVDYFEKRKTSKEVEYYDFLDKNNFGKVSNIAKYSTDLIEKIIDDDKLYTYKFLGISDTSCTNVESKMLKAMLINEEMFYDSCIKNMLKRQLDKTINQMKYGKVFAKGFYHIVVGDIKGLLEYAAGLEVKGCLQEREMYSAEMEKGKCLSMRSPLVDPSEINKITITSNEWIDKYLGYFKGSDVVMINLYDISLPQQGGMDVDGDIVCLCNNQIMLDSVIDKPIIIDTIDKVTAEPVDYNLENIIIYECNTRDSKIGQITNIATSILNKHSKNKKYQAMLDDLVSMLRIYQGKEIDFVKTSYRWEIEKWMKKSFKQIPHFLLHNYPDTKLTIHNKIRNMNHDIKDYNDRVEDNSYLSPSPLNELCFYISEWEKKKLGWGLKRKNTKELVMNNDIKINNKELIKILRKLRNDFTYKFKNLISQMDETDLIEIEEEKEMKRKELQSHISRLFNEYEIKLHKLEKEFNLTKEIIANYCIHTCYKSNAVDKMFAWSMVGEHMLKNLKKNSKGSKHHKIIETTKDDKEGKEFLGRYYKMVEVD